jgi:quercetin dioxygenase-like cupin family protein
VSRYFIDKSQRTPRTIFPGVEIRTAAGAKMMLSYVTIEPRAVVEPHSHPHEQGGIVLSGRARFIIGDEERVLGPGDMYCIPGGVTHKVVALEEGCTALDVFCPVREDYL